MDEKCTLRAYKWKKKDGLYKIKTHSKRKHGLKSSGDEEEDEDENEDEDEDEDEDEGE